MIKRSLSIILTSTLLLAGCTIPPELPQGPDAVWHLVVIGDSSLWQLGEAFASRIEKDAGVEVVFEDYTLPALSAGEVLKALQTEKSTRFFKLESLPTVLKDAEVVVMFVNPVNSIDPEKPLNLDGCFVSNAPESCEPEAFEKWTSDLQAIWAEIFRLWSPNGRVQARCEAQRSNVACNPVLARTLRLQSPPLGFACLRLW